MVCSRHSFAAEKRATRDRVKLGLVLRRHLASNTGVTPRLLSVSGINRFPDFATPIFRPSTDLLLLAQKTASQTAKNEGQSAIRLFKVVVFRQ